MNERKRGADKLSAAGSDADDPSSSSSNPPSIKELKSSMKLDLNSKVTSTKKQQQVQHAVLQTPDLIQRIILTSPDLEKFFSQSMNTVATPTPTKLLYPSPTDVTAAQRQYAQGFIDALNHIQQVNGFVPSAATASNLLSPGFLAPFVAAAVAATTAAASTTTTTVGEPKPTQTSIPPTAALVHSPTTTADQVASVIMQTMNSLHQQQSTYINQQQQHHLLASTVPPVFDQQSPTNSSIPIALATMNVKRASDDDMRASSSTFELTTLNPPTPTSTAQPTLLGYLEPTSPTSSVATSSPTSSIASSSMIPSATKNTTACTDVPLVTSATLRRSANRPALARHCSRDSDESSSTTMSGGGAKRFIANAPHFDMSDQDRMKLERKRARNRDAATKCRQRKMEKISTLEEQIKDEKDRTAELHDTYESLAKEVMLLQQKLNMHRTNGCDIMMVKSASSSRK